MRLISWFNRKQRWSKSYSPLYMELVHKEVSKLTRLNFDLSLAPELADLGRLGLLLHKGDWCVTFLLRQFSPTQLANSSLSQCACFSCYVRVKVMVRAQWGNVGSRAVCTTPGLRETRRFSLQLLDTTQPNLSPPVLTTLHRKY